MQPQKLAIITTISALLLVISTVSTITPQNATAYQKNQAASQTSDCGNEFIPVNIGCKNTDSQIQGEENAAALTAQQTFPEVKLVQKEPKPSPTPKTATLQVCKATASTSGTWDFTVISVATNTVNSEFSLEPGQCQEAVVIPGEYVILENNGVMATVSGDCHSPSNEPPAALVNIQAGEDLSCSFLNIEEEPEPQTCVECLTAFLTPEQIADYEDIVGPSPEEECTYLEGFLDDPLRFEEELDATANNLGVIGVDDETIQQIVECIERVFGL